MEEVQISVVLFYRNITFGRAEEDHVYPNTIDS